MSNLSKLGKGTGMDFSDVAELENEAVKEGNGPGNELEDIMNAVVNRPKKPDNIQVSVYLEPEVAKAFDRFGKKHGKGSKSLLVNTYLKKVLNAQKNQ